MWAEGERAARQTSVMFALIAVHEWCFQHQVIFIPSYIFCRIQVPSFLPISRQPNVYLLSLRKPLVNSVRVSYVADSLSYIFL
jgi:hypothetical protein